MHCRCNVLINHITRSMVLTVMMTVCMMNSRHSRLLPTMLLLHSIHDILSAARHLRWVRKLINLHSRERNITYSLLDNNYTNIPDCYNTCTSGVLKCMIQSDHYPIFTIRNKMEPTKLETHITRRNHSNKNSALLRKQIKSIAWE